MSDSDERPLQPGALPPARPAGRRRHSRLGRLRCWAQGRASPALTVLLTLSVVGSLLAVGTVHVATLLVVAPVALTTGALALWLEDDPAQRVSAPQALLALLALYSLLQSIALPLEWLRALSPVAAQTWTDAFRLAGASGAPWASISVQPGAARTEALKWLCYAAIFTASAKLARDERDHRTVFILLGAALLGGLLSVLHGLLGLEEWLWLYRPVYARPVWAPAPLLNPNNFAGYLNLALFSGVGLLFARECFVPRRAIALLLILLAALVFLTGSRGGVLAFAAGLVLAVLAFRRQQREALVRGHATLPSWVSLSGLGVAALSLALLGSTELVRRQLLDEATSKLKHIEQSQRLIWDHLWVGTGRGSYGTVFAAYRQDLGDGLLVYPENFIVQWVAEWGVPVAVLGLLGFYLAMRPTLHGFGRRAVPTGVFVALAVWLLQNLVDLGTEIPAVGIAAAALLGTIHGSTARARRRERPHPTSSRPQRAAVPTLLCGCCLLSGLGLVLLVATTSLPDAIAQRAALGHEYSRVRSKPRGDSAFAAVRAQIREALVRCPADPYIPLLGALVVEASGESPFAWFNQAIRRDPKSARPHFLLADVLARRGALHQALLELKTAASLSPSLVTPVAERAMRWTTSVDSLLEAVPDGAAGIPLLNALAERSADDPMRRESLLRQSLERNPREITTHALAARVLMSALDDSTAPCLADARPACEQQLKHHSAIVLESRAHPMLSTLLKAQLLAHASQFDEAERWLAERCLSLPEPVSCNHARTTYAARLTEPSRFENAALAYTASACSTAIACAAAFDWLGNLEMARNNLPSALSRFERAAEEHPTAEAWLRVAELSLRLGRPTQLRTALNAAKRFGAGPKLQELQERLRTLERDRMLEALGK